MNIFEYFHLSQAHYKSVTGDRLFFMCLAKDWIAIWKKLACHLLLSKMHHALEMELFNFFIHLNIDVLRVLNCLSCSFGHNAMGDNFSSH